MNWHGCQMASLKLLIVSFSWLSEGSHGRVSNRACFCLIISAFNQVSLQSYRFYTITTQTGINQYDDKMKTKYLTTKGIDWRISFVLHFGQSVVGPKFQCTIMLLKRNFMGDIRKQKWAKCSPFGLKYFWAETSDYQT